MGPSPSVAPRSGKRLLTGRKSDGRTTGRDWEAEVLESLSDTPQKNLRNHEHII